jgi:hypothetical protein
MATSAIPDRRSDDTSFERRVRLGIVTLCLLAGAVSVFAAPAAAGPTVEDVTVEDNESWIGLQEDHEIHVEATDINTTDAPATVTLELSGWPTDTVVGDPSVTIPTSNVDIEGNVETSGTTITFDVNDTSKATIDFEANVSVTLDHPLESSSDGVDYSIDGDVTGGDGSADSSADVTIKRLSYRVDGKERFPPSTEFVYRNQTVTVANLEPGTSYTLYEFDTEDDSLGDPIESVDPGGTTTATIDTSKESIETGRYIVYEGSDITLTDENTFQIQRQQLDATQAAGTVDSEGDGAKTTVTVGSSLRSTTFDVNVTSENLNADELFEIFDGKTNSDVERLDDSETTIVIRDVKAGDAIPMTFEPVLEATYNFEFEATDTGASDTTTVSVEKREVDAQFGSDLFKGSAGSIVEIDVSLEDTGEAYVMIGGGRNGEDQMLTNYFDILHVSGDTTIRINTRLLGTNVPAEEVYTAESGQVQSYLHDPDHEAFDDVSFEGDADDLSAFRSQIGVGPLPRPLQPERLRLVVGDSGSVIVRDDETVDFERPLARSHLLITDTEGFGNVTTYIAPEGSASEFEGEDGLGDLKAELTERRTVAKGDRVVFEIETHGITGLVSWLDDRLGSDGTEINHETLSKLLAFPDGIIFDGEQMNPGRNQRATALDIDGATDGDLYIVHEPMVESGDQQAIERYYVVMDTREAGPFDDEIEPGDRYRFEFGYGTTGETDWFDTVDHDALDPNGATPHFPYYDADADNVTETRTVTIEERTIQYDRVDSRARPIIKNETDATISGTTNLAPGTEVMIQLIPESREKAEQITINDLEVGANGTFSVTHDLSALEPGEPMTVEFYLDQQLFNKRTAIVAGTGEDLVEFGIADHPESVTLTRGEPLSGISMVVENTGYVPGRQSVEFAIGNETVDRQSVELDEDDTRTIEFDETVDIDPGEYTYTVRTDDTEATGRLIVEEPTTDPSAGNESSGIIESESSGIIDSGDAGSPADTRENTTDDSGESPADGPEESPDDSALGMLGGLIGGFGARHAIGGAAIVGGVHVVGYWI